MEKDYEAFVEKLIQALTKAIGCEESKIYFKKEKDYPRTDGDRIFVECMETEESREVCGLHVRDLYEWNLDGTTMEAIVEKTKRDLERMRYSGILGKALNLSDYERAKEDLFIRPLNLDRNRGELEGSCIYKVIGDIALVLYMRMGMIDGVLSSFKIHREMVEGWGEDTEKVFETALNNTSVLSPPRIYKWEKLIFDPSYSGDKFMNCADNFPIKKDAVGNCLSTSLRTNGAVSIFLPGVARQLGNLLGSGFYMVFTSIHEVMIHKDTEVEVEELRNVLRDTIKEATPEEDFLTLLIYHYDRTTGLFTWK